MRLGDGVGLAGGFNSGLDWGQHYAPHAVASNLISALDKESKRLLSYSDNERRR